MFKHSDFHVDVLNPTISTSGPSNRRSQCICNIRMPGLAWAIRKYRRAHGWNNGDKPVLNGHIPADRRYYIVALDEDEGDGPG